MLLRVSVYAQGRACGSGTTEGARFTPASAWILNILYT